MARKKVKKRPGIKREDWAWFITNVGTDRPHRPKKGKGSYTRKPKHGGGE
jgi:hypothetical protein